LRRAAAMGMFGGIDITGRMPVDVKSVAQLGAGMTIIKSRLGYASPSAVGFKPGLAASIDSIVTANLRAGSFPGCQVLVAREGEVVFDRSYGKQSTEGSIAVTDRTIYDIASMSKATATLAGVMKATDEGLINISEKASKYIPGLKGTDKEGLTIKDLLYHETGIPSALNMYKVMFDSESLGAPVTRATYSAQYPHKLGPRLYGNKDARLRTDITATSPSDDYDIEVAKGIYVGDAAYDTIMNRIYRIPVRNNRNYNYSCLNFALLMDAEQRVTGVAHDQWVDTEIFGPLGANRTGYRPLEFYPRDLIASTEKDVFLRKQTIQGYVHDELAAFSGGVQGNAGLFSNAGDIAKLCQMWLNG
ncbi:MAG: serine hydrolase, partial [Paramuribaculum sp.]|nr:serine hydrolase [Paramuribaculum sp.]